LERPARSSTAFIRRPPWRRKGSISASHPEAPLLISGVLLFSSLAGSSSALPQQSHNAGEAPALTQQSFRDPPLSVRPMYRWWMPLAAIEDQELRRELRAMVEAGGGGVEVDPMPVPEPIGHSIAFLRQDGFGTPLWSHHLETVFEAANQAGFGTDLLVSAEYPATVPTVSKLNDSVAQQQLLVGFEQVSAGATRSGPVPPTSKPVPTFVTDLCSTTRSGDQKIRVGATSAFTMGDIVTIGAGENTERVRIVSTTEPRPSVCATLLADLDRGADHLQLPSAPPDLSVGSKIQVDSGDSQEIVEITAINLIDGHAEIDFKPALIRAHLKGAELSSSAGELTIEPGLARDHSPGTAITDEAKRVLIAVLAAQCATSECAAEHGARLLIPSSVQDVTGLVDRNEELHWTAPAATNPWCIISFYQTADGQQISYLSETTPNYIIDHLGQQGARALENFYDSSILNPQLLGLIRKSKESALFEDSFEPSNGLKWNWNFLDEFEKRRGYSLKLLLPALAGSDVGARHPIFDFADVGERVREDYRQTWSDLYADNHMKVYKAWANRVGLRTRAQIEGGPMEVGDLASIPDIPEGENRNFINNPELWKIVGVGAQLRAKEALLSDECCPVDSGVWTTTVTGKPFPIAKGLGEPYGRPGGDEANLNWVYKAYAGGVNQIVWHGFPYFATPPGSGERSHWPGNTFNGDKGFSEAFGPMMPQWNDYREINDHLARLQLVLRQGRPQYDIAVFWHDFGVRGIVPNFTPYTGYPGLSTMFSTTSSLAGAGFTYQYVSPKYLDATTPRDITSNELFPQQIGFKAIILNRQEVMPLESLRHIRDLVEKTNFPLVVVGPTPKRVPGDSHAKTQDAELCAIVEEFRILSSKPGSNIEFVEDEASLPTALNRLGVVPAARHVSDPKSADILSVHRHTKDTDYYYLFNQGLQPVAQTLSFSGGGTPFELNTWTGRISPLSLYTAEKDQIIAPIKIGANDVRIIAVSRALGVARPTRIHATQTDAAMILVRNKQLIVRAAQNGQYQTLLSTGRKISTNVKDLPGSIELRSWKLQIESWTPDDTRLAGADHTRKTRLPVIAANAQSAGGELPTWTQLGQGDIAGIGYYSTDTVLPASWSANTGAYLDLGLVVDTFRITVNGAAVTPIDYQDTSSIDVGAYLHAGHNVIEVRVATPLRNAVEAAIKAGAPKLKTYGLVGPVTLRPYYDNMYPVLPW
jgi:hypothetical protein